MAGALHEWRNRDRLSAARLNELVEAARSVTPISGVGGIGVLQTNAGTTVWNYDTPSVRQMLTVQITGPAAGGRIYEGRVWNDSKTPINPAVDLTDAHVGSIGEEILIISPAEPTGSGHDLTDGGQTRTLYAARWHSAKATDGRRVAIIDSFDWLDCEGGEADDEEIEEGEVP